MSIETIAVWLGIIVLILSISVVALGITLNQLMDKALDDTDKDDEQ